MKKRFGWIMGSLFLVLGTQAFSNEYPGLTGEECTIERVHGTRGEGLFRVWTIDLWNLNGYGTRGISRLSDAYFTIDITHTETETCVYTYDDGSENTQAYVTHAGRVMGMPGDVKVTTWEEDGVPAFSISMKIADALSNDDLYLNYVLYQLPNDNIEGYVQGTVPTRDGRWMRVQGSAGIYENRKG